MSVQSRLAFMLLGVFVFDGSLPSNRLAAQESASLSSTDRRALGVLADELSAAMLAGQIEEVGRISARARAVLGDQAGLPETRDEFRPVPESARSISREELASAFDPYLPVIRRQRWWRVGLDPNRTNHALREVANVIEGCLAARSVSPQRADELITIAREAGDFLVWTQDQGGTGVFPFPAVRNGRGRPFEVAEAFYRRAERDGRLGEVVRNGWSVEDFDDGGLQFDNGLAGVAVLHLYEATQEDRYRRAAVRSADWTLGRRVVTNWNYNSFSVYLLAETYRVTGEPKYLAAAKQKTKLGMLPGQLTDGPRKGRWADPHNARPPYHYIMIRALAALAAVLPENDPDFEPILESLRLALQARNFDFRRGIFNADSSVEALVLVRSLPAAASQKLTDCGTEEALETLSRYAADRFRNGKAALGPAAWGQLLAAERRRFDEGVGASTD